MPQPVTIRSPLEKPLLKLHSAMDLGALWRAVQRIINIALPGSFIGLTLQHNPIRPMITRWTGPIPGGPFDSTPLKRYFDSHPRRRLVRSSDVFRERSRLVRSDFYRG